MVGRSIPFLALLAVAACRTPQGSRVLDDGDQPLPSVHVEIDQKAPHLSNTKIDVLGYDVDLVFPSFAAAPVKARAVVTLRLLVASEDVRLHMDKTRAAVSAVTVDGDVATFTLLAGQAGGHGLKGDVLAVKLPSVGRAGQDVTIVIDYSISPTSTGLDGMVFRSTFKGAPIFTTRSWPYYARFWLPSNDHPGDTATFKSTLHVPASAVAVANGRLVAGTPRDGEGVQADGLRLFRWEQPTPIPVHGLNVTVGELDIVEDTVCFDTAEVNDTLVDCAAAAYRVPTSFYVQRRNPQRQEFLDAAKKGAKSLAFFSSLLAPYPYEKVGYATAPQPFNMESVSLIVMVSPEATVHEVAHHWWGNTVYIGHWGDFWISEGFTTYFTGLYDEFASGTNTACSQTSGVLNAPPETDPMAIFDDTPYCKGAAALKDLRHRIAQLAGVPGGSSEGRAIFFTLAHQLFADYRFKRLTTVALGEWLAAHTVDVLATHGTTAPQSAVDAMLVAWKGVWLAP